MHHVLNPFDIGDDGEPFSPQQMTDADLCVLPRAALGSMPAKSAAVS